MDMLKTFFPFAFKSTDNNSLVVSLIIHVIIGVVCGAIIGLLAKIPVIGILFTIIGAVVGLYALIGIVLSILVFAKVIE